MGCAVRALNHCGIVFGALLVAGCASAARAADAAPGPLIALTGPGSELRAEIAPQNGAELVGLEFRYRGQWIELLYRGMDFSATTDWDGKAPILWPATGRNATVDPATGKKAPGWLWKGTFYPIPIHGFARDLPWQVVGQSETAEGKTVTLAFSDNAQTRKAYPFGFRITTDYVVGRTTLTIHQRVHAVADNASPMPFSIGNHMTYKLPLVPGGAADAVKFSTAATRQLLLDDGGYPTGQSAPFGAETPRPVSDLGTRKAVSLTGFSGEPAVKIIDPSGLTLTVSHHESRRPSGDPVYFNLWGDTATGFLAPEPWAGKQNSLVMQDGTVQLEPGADFDWTITVSLR